MDGFLKRENLTAILSVRVCHFTKEVPRRTQAGSSGTDIGLGDILFIRKSQSTSPKDYYIGARKLNQARYRQFSLLCANKRNLNLNFVSSIEATETIYSCHSMEIYKSIVCFEVVTGIS